MNTASAFNKASAAVAAAALDLLAQRVSIAEIDDDIKLVKDEVARIQAYQQQIRDFAASIERDEATPQLLQRLESLAGQLERTTPLLEQAANRLTELTAAHWVRVRSLLERAITLGLNAQKLVREAQLAARKELEMSPMGDDYAAEIDRIDREMIATVRETLEQLERQLS